MSDLSKRVNHATVVGITGSEFKDLALGDCSFIGFEVESGESPFRNNGEVVISKHLVLIPKDWYEKNVRDSLYEETLVKVEGSMEQLSGNDNDGNEVRMNFILAHKIDIETDTGVCEDCASNVTKH